MCMKIEMTFLIWITCSLFPINVFSSYVKKDKSPFHSSKNSSNGKKCKHFITKLTKDEKMITILLHFILYPNLPYRNNLLPHIPFPEEFVSLNISCGIIAFFHQFNNHYIPSYFHFLLLQVSRAWLWWIWTLNWKVYVSQKVK